jgi:hypothetical protein
MPKNALKQKKRVFLREKSPAKIEEAIHKVTLNPNFVYFKAACYFCFFMFYVRLVLQKAFTFKWNLTLGGYVGC